MDAADVNANNVNVVLHTVAKRVWAELPKDQFESSIDIDDFKDVVMLSECAGLYREALLHFIDEERQLTVCNDLFLLSIDGRFNLQLNILADILSFVNLGDYNDPDTQCYIDEFWPAFEKKAARYI